MTDIYITKNISLSAFLYASELRFVGAKKINKEYFFEFSPRDKAELLIKNYFAGKALVNPQELFARLHDLRDLIFSESKKNYGEKDAKGGE